MKKNFLDTIFGKQIHKEIRFSDYERDIQGVKHRGVRDPYLPEGGFGSIIQLTTCGPDIFQDVICEYSVEDRDQDEIGSGSIELRKSHLDWNLLIWDYVQYWEGTLPPFPEGSIVRYRIYAQTLGSDQYLYADSQTNNRSDATVFGYTVGALRPPSWARKAVIYQVFVDRFFPGAGVDWLQPDNLLGFFGGTLRGIIEKLDYLQSMGINTLWLSPIFSSPSHHGYDATDLFTIEARIGSKRDFEDLIEEAHQRSIRILLDFVPNHWSDRHPTFQSASTDPLSPYRKWYHWINWPAEYDSFFDNPGMPRLDLRDQHGARDYVLEAASYWLKQGVDGYRLDHADGPVTDFWVDFRQTCLTANPECWLFGEVVRPPSVQRLFTGDLHGMLDFSMAQALRETFGLENWNIERFASFIQNHYRYFSRDFSLPTFLDNHDLDRFFFICGEDPKRLMLAGLVLFSLPQVPVLYYGSEIGLTQRRSIETGDGFDEARLPMDWNAVNTSPLPGYFKRLAKLRNRFMDILTTTPEICFLNSGECTFAYRYGQGEESVLIAVNRGDREVELPIQSPESGSFMDYLFGNPIRRSGSGRTTVKLEPRSGAFIARSHFSEKTI